MFWLNKHSKDGIDYYCKRCRSKVPIEKKIVAEEKRLLLEKEQKRCSKCNEIFPFSNFHKAAYGCGGVVAVCKGCNLKYRKEHKDLIYASGKKWRQNNIERSNERARNWRKSNPDKVTEICAKSDKKRRLQKTEYLRKKRKTDSSYKIGTNLRRRTNRALKSQYAKKCFKFDEYLGCTLTFFKSYFESKFQEGMTWNGYLNGEIHIDHIKPCVLFNLTDIAQQKECFHYTNLQPLWAKDNFRKGAKVYEKNTA